MRFLPQHSGGRREFLRELVRYCVLGLLALVAAFLGRSTAARRSCINRGMCRGCVAFVDCDLPPALSAKGSFEGRGAGLSRSGPTAYRRLGNT